MGLKLERAKRRNLLVSLLYRLDMLLFFLSPNRKLKLYLDLTWIFARFAHEYSFKSTFHNTPEPVETDFLVDKVSADSKILDLGCGKGYVSKRLLAKTSNILGIDYNADSIEAAKNLTADPNVRFICDDIFNYLKQNPDEKFNAIILSHVLEHIDDSENFLCKLSKLGLADFFYIEVPDFQATYLNYYRLKVKTDLIYTDSDHVYEFDRQELRQMIEAANLEILDSLFVDGVIKYWCRSKVS